MAEEGKAGLLLLLEEEIGLPRRSSSEGKKSDVQEAKAGTGDNLIND